MKHVLAVTVLLLAAQCSNASETYKDALIKDVPHVTQKPDFCGEACMEMYLKKLGKEITQDQVFTLSGIDPMIARGCVTKELADVLKKIGFSVGPVWYSVPANNNDALELIWKSLHEDLLKGFPSIVCTEYDDKPHTTEHFRLILGYDAKTNEVIYHEPAEDGGGYRHMARPMFMKLWPLKYGAQQWTVIRMKLEPGKIDIVPEKTTTFTNADYCQHKMKLDKLVPTTGFTVVLEPPFFVIGDGDARVVKALAKQTVAWTTTMLKQDYFTRNPSEIIDVWLFKDKASFEKYAKELFNDTPDTPFGYYSDTNHALIMNISTSGGTLVHEMVHPFMRTNFPECPAWFNEGLASLYEQCGEKDNHIYGYTNWRLAGLKEAISKNKLPTFEDLMGMNDYMFYNTDRGDNYAQARYLCYYLQSKGMLVKFYKDFVADKKNDPTGFKTLKKALDEEDMSAFQDKWQKYVMKLKFPE